MSKKQTAFVCNHCGHESLRWLGQCPSCQEWGTMTELDVTPIDLGTNEKISLTKISKNIVELKRIPSGSSEMDRVLGGGLVPSEAVLISGEPGIGKSTLLLQLCARFTGKTIYISAEESFDQIALRAHRLGITKELGVVSAFDVNQILDLISKEKPDLVVIDSIQTVSDLQANGLPGGISQIKSCAAKIVSFAKKNNVIIFIVGQITKDGDIAGPKLLEHIVDVVLHLEGDERRGFRILRNFKNRFGPTQEIGIFEMNEKGLIDVTNPHIYFFDDKEHHPGSTPGIIIEGNRVLFVDVQALCARSYLPFPKRVAEGISRNKLELILAVLSKFSKINLSDKDVYVSIAGGLKSRDPLLDLPTLISIITSASDKIPKKKFVAYGEIALSGKIIVYDRMRAMIENEIERMGYMSFAKLFPKIKEVRDLGALL